MLIHLCKCPAAALPRTAGRPGICIENQSQTMFPRMVNMTGRPAARRSSPRGTRMALAGAVAALAVAAAGCSSTATSASSAKTTVINVIGAENEYADVLAQIGGRYVHVSSIL